MRGKGVWAQRIDEVGGITPAHAGKSHAVKVHLHRDRDHPRPCGEKMPTSNNGIGNIGSPPPMRGKDGDKLPAVRLSGITPAHAGKSY